MKINFIITKWWGFYRPLNGITTNKNVICFEQIKINIKKSKIKKKKQSF